MRFHELFLFAGSLLWVELCPTLSEPTGEMCPEVDENSESCVCRSPEGILDLRELSNRNGTARFKDVVDNHHYYYDFNPCQAFIDEGGCINVHVCQGANFDSTAHYSIAEQGTEELWIDSTKGPYLYYTGYGSREVKVFLHCDQRGEDKLTTTGDSSTSLIYLFDLYSCHACPGGCDNSNTANRVGVVGFLLIFLVFLGFATYFAIGAVVLRFHYSMTGRNIIPHRDFWNDLPFLIRDGWSFVFGSFVHAVTAPKEKSQTRLDYESHL